MGQLCSCHSGKVNQRKDFSSSWSNLLSRRPTWSSWRRRRLKSVEFLGHDNLPYDPVPNRAFQLLNRCEKHLAFVSHRTRSAPERNEVGVAETDDVSDAEPCRVSEPERKLLVNDAERSGVAEERDVAMGRMLGRESLWENSAEGTKRKRVTHQWHGRSRSNGAVRSLNLPDTGTVQPPLARFLRKKRPNDQLNGGGGPLEGDPWSCARLAEDAREWLCGQLDPWMLFQSLQGLHRRGDAGLLALELGRCTTTKDSCRCLLDYATSVPTETDDDEDQRKRQPPNFRLIRELLGAFKDDTRLTQIAQFLEAIDAIVDLSRSTRSSQEHVQQSATSERTSEEFSSNDRPEGTQEDSPGDLLKESSTPDPIPEVPTKDFGQKKDGYFRSEILHPSQPRQCLYTTCVSMGGEPTNPPIHRDKSFTRRRHSALCHSDDEPRTLWAPPPPHPPPGTLTAFQPEVPSLSLSICSVDLDEDCVRQLARIVSGYPHVTHLSVVRTGLGKDGFEDLCRAFDRTSSSSSSSQRGGVKGGIEHFDFRMNPLLDGDSIGHLSAALSCATSLRSVNLSSTGLSGEACRCLVDALRSSGSAANRVLAELDLGYNELSDEGCVAVAALIETPGCWLRTLRLRHNGIGVVGARRLASALLGHPKLTLLDVSSNPIGDEGVASLAGALLGNRTLRDVAIDDCGISSEGCRGVARMLMTNSVLRSITLSRNHLGDDGVRTLGEGMRYNRTVEVIGIDMCSFGNAGFVALVQDLRCCHSLRVLRACYNTIGIPDHLQSPGNRRWSSASVRFDVAAAAALHGPAGGESSPQLLDVYVQLCEVLQKNPKLKIFLWGNRIDEDDDDVTSASAFRPEVGDPGAKWRRSNSALDSGYGTLSRDG